MEHAESPRTEGTNTTSGKGKSVGIVVALVAIAIIVVGAVMMGGAFSSTSEQATMADEFVNLLADEQYDTAYAMASVDFKDSTTLDQLTVFVENFPVLADATSTTFNYRGIEDDMVVISGTVMAGEDESPLTVQFVEEDGEWKILLFSLDPADVPSMDDESDDFFEDDSQDIEINIEGEEVLDGEEVVDEATGEETEEEASEE